MSITQLRTEFDEALTDFLKVRVESEHGGYAPVSWQDLDAFLNLIFLLEQLKWGTDADGDLPLGYHVWRRKTHWQLINGCIRHTSDQTVPELYKTLGDIGSMIGSLGDAYRLVLNQIDYRNRASL